MNAGISAINAEVQQASAFVPTLLNEINKVVIGQKYLVERLIIGLLANGHVLLEGVPGLAKTLSVKTLASAIDVRFSRLQFTPDMLPADVIGTQIYNPQSGAFTTRRGPIFAHLVLADEINRAPAKVQSALLYPNREEERQILDLMARTSGLPGAGAVVEAKTILAAREVINDIYIDDKVKDYIVDLVCATRDPAHYKIDVKEFIQLGASPRATIALALAGKAYAFLRGRGYVTPQDVKSIGMDVLRHRVAITYEAEAEEKTSETIIQKVFDELPVP